MPGFCFAILKKDTYKRKVIMINDLVCEMISLNKRAPKIIELVKKCGKCPQPVTDADCAPGEQLPKIEGVPIHRHCYYGLNSTKGVRPPQHPREPFFCQIVTSDLPQVASSV